MPTLPNNDPSRLYSKKNGRYQTVGTNRSFEWFPQEGLWLRFKTKIGDCSSFISKLEDLPKPGTVLAAIPLLTEQIREVLLETRTAPISLHELARKIAERIVTGPGDTGGVERNGDESKKG